MHGSIFAKVFLIVLAVDLLLDWYTFQQGKDTDGGLGVTCCAAVGQLGLAGCRRRHHRGAGRGFRQFPPGQRHDAFSGMDPESLYRLFLTKNLFAIVLLLGDIGRLIYGLVDQSWCGPSVRRVYRLFRRGANSSASWVCWWRRSLFHRLCHVEKCVQTPMATPHSRYS